MAFFNSSALAKIVLASFAVDSVSAVKVGSIKQEPKTKPTTWGPNGKRTIPYTRYKIETDMKSGKAVMDLDSEEFEAALNDGRTERKGSEARIRKVEAEYYSKKGRTAQYHQDCSSHEKTHVLPFKFVSEFTPDTKKYSEYTVTFNANPSAWTLEKVAFSNLKLDATGLHGMNEYIGKDKDALQLDDDEDGILELNSNEFANLIAEARQNGMEQARVDEFKAEYQRRQEISNAGLTMRFSQWFKLAEKLHKKATDKHNKVWFDRKMDDAFKYAAKKVGTQYVQENSHGAGLDSTANNSLEKAYKALKTEKELFGMTNQAARNDEDVQLRRVKLLTDWLNWFLIVQDSSDELAPQRKEARRSAFNKILAEVRGA